jgi:tRNA(His) 5'-end guanylyltransferase
MLLELGRADGLRQMAFGSCCVEHPATEILSYFTRRKIRTLRNFDIDVAAV